MKTYHLPHTDLRVSRLAYGCMQLGGRWDTGPVSAEERKAAEAAVRTALEAGLTLFDHADIYTLGKSEAVFGDLLHAHPGLRDQIILQSKCGIRFADDPTPGAPKRYDFSHAHLVHAVEGSLRRLRTDRLEILLLHRPDPLMEPEEVARAFDDLHTAGKVRHFGVSNHTTGQIDLLRRHLRQPLVTHQVELSLAHPALIDEGVMANRADAASALATGMLDDARAHHLLVQAWSPLGGARLLGEPPEPRLQRVADLLRQMAREHQTAPEAVALAWLLRHPAGIQPVIGTTRPDRIRANCLADGLELSREAWYALWTAARGGEVP